MAGESFRRIYHRYAQRSVYSRRGDGFTAGILRTMINGRLMAMAAFCILATSLSMVPASLAEEAVSSQIKEVTLFSNQALIKREATVKVKQGVNELYLSTDVFQIDRDSVSAKVFGEGEILSVQSRDIYLKEPPQENIKALELKIEQLKLSKSALMDEMSVLRKKELFLDALVNFSQTQVPQDVKTSFPNMEDLDKTLTFLSTNFQSINEQKQALETRIRGMDKEIEVLAKELASLSRKPRQATTIIEVLFKAGKEQTIRIEASYLARNASWNPLYKVAVPPSLDEIDLTLFSKIQQKTGEDWKGINLSILNIVPLRGISLPSLGSWTIDVARPFRQRAMRNERIFSLQKGLQAPSAPAEEKAEPLADSEELYEEEATLATAQREELPLSFEYKIPQKIDISSQDKETILPLFTRKLKGEFFYYAVPQASSLTYLVCQARDDKELLSGPLNVYFSDRFVGKTHLSEKKAGEEFHVNLGADREVKVRREKITDKVKETFFGKIERNTVIKELAYKIALENMKDKPVRIKILDAIPVSRTDMIKVEDISLVPEPKEKHYQDQEGVLLWDFELKPHDQREVTISFVVTYPKDSPPFGL